MPLIDPVTMSSSPSTSSSPPKSTKSTLPIDTFPTALAQTFSHAHPLLLLSHYYLRFPALVSSPTSTLLRSLLPVAGIQIAYAIICLPPAGTAARRAAKKLRKPAEKKGSGNGSGGDPTVKPFTAFVALIFAFLSILPLTIIQILFGAPLTTHLPHTILCSAHIAVLAIFPFFYVHGISSTPSVASSAVDSSSTTSPWREILAFYAPVDEVFGAFMGALVGAWVGAVPIPLDWDREWQKWPVTIVTGVYIGYVLGKTIGGLGWVRGRRLRLD